MESNSSSGSASYRGYEYQLHSTVWVALELMLHQGVCSEIEIEPPSDEDVEAVLAVPPEKAESGVTSVLLTRRIHVQIKLRSAPWTVGDMGHVVECDAESSTRSSRGPKKRSRALQNLNTDPMLQYVLLTNAEVTKDLKDYCVDTLGKEPTAVDLPSSWNVPAKTSRADLAKRLCILEKLDFEILEHRIRDLLMRYGYVPHVNSLRCLTALVEDARTRLLKPAPWTKAQLEDRLRQFDGMPAPTSEMSAFVPPSNFEQIQRSLNDKNSVILLGPPGVGKTLVADMLVYEYRRKIPYQVVYEDRGPHYIRECLSKAEPFLFYLRDPWGDYRLRAEASAWITEMPKLLQQATANKRFLITSRTAILDQAGSKLSRKKLEAYAIKIEPAHYPLKIRKQILLKWLQSSLSWQREIVSQYERQILGALTVPFSIVRFSNLLMKKNSRSRVRIDNLLERAQVESVQAAVVEEVCGRGNSDPSDVIVLWAWLNAFRKISPNECDLLSEAMETGGHPTGLRQAADWMTTAGWLRRLGTDYEVSHPTVMAGLERLFLERPDQARQAIQALLRGLVSLGHVPSVHQIVQRTTHRNLRLPSTVQDAVNQHLLGQLHEAGNDSYALSQACQALALSSTARDPLSLIAAALVPMRGRPALTEDSPLSDDEEEAEDDGFHDVTSSFDLDTWQDPAWSTEEFEQVSKSKEALSLASRFVEECLADMHGFDGERLLALFARLKWDISEQFNNAASRVVYQGGQQVEVIFQGAISGDIPPYDRLLGWLLDSVEELEKSDPKSEESLRAAEQDELDAEHTESIIEKSDSELYWSLRNALKCVILKRRRSEGYNWLLTHPRLQAILPHWAATLSAKDNAEDMKAEVHAILAACPANDPRPAWVAIGCTKQNNLLYVLDRGLTEGLFLRDCIETLVSCLSSEEFGAYLCSITKAWPFEQRANLVFQTIKDFALSSAQNKSEYRKALNTLLDPTELGIVDSCLALSDKNSSLHGPANSSIEQVSLLQTLASNDINLALRARALYRLATVQPTSVSVSFLTLAAPCMVSQDWQIRFDAFRSLAALKSPSADAVLSSALADPDYRCRQYAIEVLAERATPEMQATILELYKDKSAGVRIACAQAIGQQRWSPGARFLLNLLHDTHNAGRGQHEVFDVAREAAKSFGRLHPLEKEIFEELLKFLQDSIERWDDIGVPFLLIGSLRSADDPRLMALLARTLEHPGYFEGSEYPGYPLRYAAVWLLLKHLCGESAQRTSAPLEAITIAAQDSDGRLAGPALLLLGCLGQVAAQGRRLVSEAQETTAERRLLLVASERLFGTSDAGAIDGQKMPGFRALAWLEANRTLDNEEWKHWIDKEPDVLNWLQNLAVTADVNPCLRFILSKFSNLKRTHLSYKDLRDREL